MLERVLLHIGIEKTGTKTLQVTLAQNRDLLRQNGFVYPALPGVQHVGLALYASNGPSTFDMRTLAGLGDSEQYAEFMQRFPISLAEMVSVTGVHTALLSSEHCSSRLSTVEEITRLHRLISPLTHECRVIVYLRRQDELMISCYSEDVQAGHTEEFGFSEGVFWFDYLKLLDMWAAVFGRDNLDIRVFEPQQMEESDLIADFSSAISFAQYDRMQRVPNQNQSLDIEALEFLRRFNAHVPVFAAGVPNPSRGLVSQAIASLSAGDRLKPPEETATAFLDRYAATNAEVARKYLNRADGVLFTRRPSAGQVARLPSLDVSKAIDIAAKLWEWQERRFRELEQSM